jgi:phosphatidate cytidylyltransferase
VLAWPSPPLRRRIGSALVLGPPVLGAIWLGGWAFAALVVTAMALLAWEWARLFRLEPPALPGTLLLVGLVAAVGLDAWLGPLVGGALVVCGALVVLLVSGRPWLAAGMLYFGLPGLALVWLRQADAGQWLVLWVFGVVWASDIGAFLVGSTVGGPKLAPAISPNKTWSGFCGGLVAAIAVGMLIARLGAGWGEATPWGALALAGLAAAVGIAAQAGDLIESWIKRRFGVKDSGGLIPGHGGLLDRVDGLLLASLATALIVAGSGGSIGIPS